MKTVDTKKLIHLYNNGVKLKDIQKILGVGERVIVRTIKELNLTRVYKRDISHKIKEHEEYIGKKFSYLTIQSFIIDNNNTLKCNVQCDCNNKKIFFLRDLLNGKRVTCGINGCEFFHKVRQENGRKSAFTGYEEIYGSRWSGWICGAKSRNIPFEITPEYGWNVFLAQDRKCALSGLPLEFGNSWNKKITASLDRIDSSKGYIEGNIQWVHKRLNLMKGQMNDLEFIEWCTMVHKHNEKCHEGREAINKG